MFLGIFLFLFPLLFYTTVIFSFNRFYVNREHIMRGKVLKTLLLNHFRLFFVISPGVTKYGNLRQRLFSPFPLEFPLQRREDGVNRVS